MNEKDMKDIPVLKKNRSVYLDKVTTTINYLTLYLQQEKQVPMKDVLSLPANINYIARLYAYFHKTNHDKFSIFADPSYREFNIKEFMLSLLAMYKKYHENMDDKVLLTRSTDLSFKHDYDHSLILVNGKGLSTPVRYYDLKRIFARGTVPAE